MADTIRKYIAVGNGNYLTPSNPTTIEISNVRGIQDGAKFIIENIKFDPKRFTSAGYGENHPDPLLLASVIKDKVITEFSPREWRRVVARCNDTGKKRARNRRVDIVVRRIELSDMRIWREQEEKQKKLASEK